MLWTFPCCALWLRVASSTSFCARDVHKRFVPLCIGAIPFRIIILLRNERLLIVFLVLPYLSYVAAFITVLYIEYTKKCLLIYSIYLYKLGLGQYIDASRIEKWFSIDSEIFRMHGDSSGIDSELSFEHGAACFRNRRTLLVSKSLHTLEPKIIIYKIRKGWSELQGCSQWAVFTLISCHKSILSRGEITDSAERTSALQRSSSSAFECVDKN